MKDVIVGYRLDLDKKYYLSEISVRDEQPSACFHFVGIVKYKDEEYRIYTGRSEMITVRFWVGSVIPPKYHINNKLNKIIKKMVCLYLNDKTCEWFEKERERTGCFRKCIKGSPGWGAW